MKWRKQGLIIEPDKSKWWSQYYAILPTPEFLVNENLIRIYYASADADRNGRIFFIDVNADNPGETVFQSHQPMLDIGEPGTFDDSGVCPCSIVNLGAEKYLYYVGFQRCEKVPYMLFSGLATGDGNSFHRLSPAPIIDRTSHSFLSAAAPYVLKEQDIFKMWLWIGKQWLTVNGKKYLSANIGYAESSDGLHWNLINDHCIVPALQNEFSLGRPWVIREKNRYRMWYSVRYIDKLYRIGYAESADGLNWTRKDSEVGIDVSDSGWDSEMICYPSVIKVKDRTYMFYNGNRNGETGFGYALLEEE